MPTSKNNHGSIPLCNKQLLVSGRGNFGQEDVDVERHLPELSTYLGHVKVSDTYWYLSATPELLGLATQRLEQGHRRLSS